MAGINASISVRRAEDRGFVEEVWKGERYKATPLLPMEESASTSKDASCGGGSEDEEGAHGTS